MEIFVFQLFYYANTEAIDPVELTIANCPRPCTLTKLSLDFNSIIYRGDYDKLCKV